MLPAGIMIMSNGTLWRPSGKLIAQTIHRRTGYRYITLHMEGRSRVFRVNRLVCEAFHGPPPSPKHQARHLDGDRLNNAAWNLAWGTRKENEADKRRHGRVPVGEAHGQAKVTASQVLEIRNRYAVGGVSTQALGQEFGLAHTTVGNIVRGKTWVHVAGPIDTSVAASNRSRNHVKVTETQVREIRERWAAGGVSQGELAADYGITASGVWRIIHRKSWQHI
jgi:hypothetical protein